MVKKSPYEKEIYNFINTHAKFLCDTAKEYFSCYKHSDKNQSLP